MLDNGLQNEARVKKTARGLAKPIGLFQRLRSWFSLRAIMPKGLWARTILIVLIPVILLQFAVGYTFLQNHWQLFTEKLTAGLVSNIAVIIDLYEDDPSPENLEKISERAFKHLDLNVNFLADGQLPQISERPFFDLLDRTLSSQLKQKMPYGFWFDTVGRSDLVEIRIALKHNILQVIAQRSRAFADESAWFLINIASFTLVMALLAIFVLHNQVRPIVRLAKAMDEFGHGGQETPFVPRGATEIRQAGLNFLRMRRRIERFIDQRGNLLSGISHDLRTILTRVRLDLEMMEQDEGVAKIIGEIEAMTRMLNAYLSFAREVAKDEIEEVLLIDLIANIEQHYSADPLDLVVQYTDDQAVADACVGMNLKRILINVLNNASRYATKAILTIKHDQRRSILSLILDDNGPGIPLAERERVFQPFYQHQANDIFDDDLPKTFGLGLAITRDLIQSLGGQITLTDSPYGGLRIHIGIPMFRA